jgi:hypothetical protein
MDEHDSILGKSWNSFATDSGVHPDFSPVAAGGTLSSVLASLSQKLPAHFH